MRDEMRNAALVKPYGMTDEDKSRVDSFEEDGSIELPKSYGVIVEDESGFLFTHQVGGFACLHPKIKGYFWEGGKELEDCLNEIQEWVYTEFGGACVPEGHFFISEGGFAFAGPLTNRDRCVVNDIFCKHGFANLEIDRNRLNESCEAWILGNLYGASDEWQSEKPMRCVFVTPNSD